MKPFESEWQTWGDENSHTPYQGTDKTDKRASKGGLEPELSRKVLPFPPTAEDLRLPLTYVRNQFPSLPLADQDRFACWRDLFVSRGWSREVSERAAFRRTLRCSLGPEVTAEWSS